MPEPARLLAALIRARRSGDRAAVAAALTRLRQLGVRIQYGDSIPPPRPTKCVTRDADGNPSRAGR